LQLNGCVSLLFQFALWSAVTVPKRLSVLINIPGWNVEFKTLLAV
jgi:hypothetical protein